MVKYYCSEMYFALANKAQATGPDKHVNYISETLINNPSMENYEQFKWLKNRLRCCSDVVYFFSLTGFCLLSEHKVHPNILVYLFKSLG